MAIHCFLSLVPVYHVAHILLMVNTFIFATESSHQQAECSAHTEHLTEVKLALEFGGTLKYAKPRGIDSFCSHASWETISRILRT